MTLSVLIMLFLLLLAIASYGVTSGILFARDQRRYNNAIEDIEQLCNFTETLISEVEGLICNTTCCDNFTFPADFPDDLFRIFDFNDFTAGFQFNASAVPGNTTTQLEIQDIPICTVALLSDLPVVTSTFQDDMFAVQHFANPTQEIMFDLSNVPATTVVELTVPNISGTIAYLVDIPAASSIFPEDLFAIQDDVDPTKELVFNISGTVTPGATRNLAVQNISGTVAFESDLPPAGGVPANVSDAEFGVYNDTDTTALILWDLSLVSTGTDQEMAVQNKSGTIAYLDDLPSVVEVFCNTSCIFPLSGNISDLGDVQKIEITFCGAGGGGGADTDEGQGEPGGTGSGHQNFVIYDPASKFYQINCSVGAGGGGNFGSDGDDGTPTFLTGLSATGNFLELVGYGGGGGEDGNVAGDEPGAGGGGGGSANGIVAGIAGTEGGLVGGDFNNNTFGPLNLPWRSGSAGGDPWLGGQSFGGPFLPTGSGAAPCQGGQSDGPAGLTGGDGACLFRYYLNAA